MGASLKSFLRRFIGAVSLVTVWLLTAWGAYGFFFGRSYEQLPLVVQNLLPNPNLSLSVNKYLVVAIVLISAFLAYHRLFEEKVAALSLSAGNHIEKMRYWMGYVGSFDFEKNNITNADEWSRLRALLPAEVVQEIERPIRTYPGLAFGRPRTDKTILLDALAKMEQEAEQDHRGKQSGPTISRPRILKLPQQTWLEIMNEGDQAEFEAEIVTLIAGRTALPNKVRAYWQNTRSNKSTIKRGLSDQILLAEHEHLLAGGTTPTHRFALAYYDGGDSYRLTGWSGVWSPSLKGVIKDSCEIEVRISASPSLPPGEYIYCYRLLADSTHIEEINCGA